MTRYRASAGGVFAWGLISAAGLIVAAYTFGAHWGLEVRSTVESVRLCRRPCQSHVVLRPFTGGRRVASVDAGGIHGELPADVKPGDRVEKNRWTLGLRVNGRHRRWPGWPFVGSAIAVGVLAGLLARWEWRKVRRQDDVASEVRKALDPLALSSIVSTKWVVIFWLVCCVIMAVRAIWSELRIVADVILAFWIAGMGAAFVRALWKRRQR